MAAGDLKLPKNYKETLTSEIHPHERKTTKPKDPKQHQSSQRKNSFDSNSATTNDFPNLTPRDHIQNQQGRISLF